MMDICDFEREFEELFPWDKEDFILKYMGSVVDANDVKTFYDIKNEEELIDSLSDFEIIDEVDRRDLKEDIISRIPEAQLMEYVLERIGVEKVLDHVNQYYPEEHQEWYWGQPEFMRTEEEWRKLENEQN